MVSAEIVQGFTILGQGHGELQLRGGLQACHEVRKCNECNEVTMIGIYVYIYIQHIHL